MMNKVILGLGIMALALGSCQNSGKQETAAVNQEPVNYLNESAEDRATRMEWWKDARFGMFIHWGLYAIPAGEYQGRRNEGIGEWIMDHQQIPIAEYEKYAPQFNPVKFNAKEWVQIAKDAGMKYIVITSKHHDGFGLWDSKVSEWDVMDATPFKRDILKELADACEAEGIKLCFYHSIMDWHHPDAQAILEPDYNRGRESTDINPNFPRYLENYMKPQLQELLTNYGDIGVVWFDGEWVPDYTSEQGKDVYNFVRNLKPDVIINNRVDKGRQGMMGMNKEGDFAGDFGTPEQEIPDTGMPGVDWESCMTMNDTWGFKHFDENWKSEETLIRNLVDIVSKGGNFLLNVGPQADGEIPAASVERLAAMGRWMKFNGESIYGAEASPVEHPVWGRYTSKGNKIYAHVFEWPANGKLDVNGIGTVKKAYLLNDPSKTFTVNGTQVELQGSAPDKVASVVALEI
jgi:alpha-L-fucosidase